MINNSELTQLLTDTADKTTIELSTELVRDLVETIQELRSYAFDLERILNEESGEAVMSIS